MNIYLLEFFNNLSLLPRYSKQAVAIIFDLALCFACTWVAFILRLEQFILFKDLNFYSALISMIIAIPIFWLFGLYKTIFKFPGFSIFVTVLISVVFYGFFYFLVIGVYGIKGVPISIGILQPLLLFFAIISSRLGIKYILTGNFINKKTMNKKNILIYGAGEAGRQLALALENSPEFKVVGFLDDNHLLHKSSILGQYVYSQSNLQKLINVKNISMIFLALPSISRSKKNEIIERLSQHNLIVKTLPSISQLVDNRITISDIKDFNVEDLLNRDEIKPDVNLLNKNIYSKNVLVTGAGGSIGSELCRQIIRLKPNKLILLELNEFALYKINEELLHLCKDLQIVLLLVNIQDQKKIEMIFDIYKVDTIYHAAAYKHVPLVEENIIEGIKNNVFGTLAIANASVKKNISNFVLISTDKAVRPTNVMGASKRLAEICIQGLNNRNKKIITNFAIVRFGNVLESSGSVIPKFKKQIKEGGPITLTHLDVTRYFMTISEAAQLVIQAGAMGKNSEVFVLDMGESVKISDLVHKMIKLSGFTVKDVKNPNGDIEIKITGLRPGEKLFEELLIGDNPQKTRHGKILKAQDDFIPFDQLKIDLDNLYALLERNDVVRVLKILGKLVSLYQPNPNIVDNIYKEHLSSQESVKIGYIMGENQNKIINLNTQD